MKLEKRCSKPLDKGLAKKELTCNLLLREMYPLAKEKLMEWARNLMWGYEGRLGKASAYLTIFVWGAKLFMDFIKDQDVANLAKQSYMSAEVVNMIDNALAINIRGLI